MPFWTILLAALIALLTGGGEFLLQKRHPISIGILTFITILPMYYVANVVQMQPIHHLLDLYDYLIWGLIVGFSWSAVFALARIFTSHEPSGGGALLTSAFAIVVVLVFGIGWLVINPQEITVLGIKACDKPQYDQLAHLLTFDEATTPRHDTDPNALVQVSPNVAISLAKGELVGLASTYLKVETSQLQYIQGHPYHIVVPQASSLFAFNANEGATKGYVDRYYRIDAMDGIDPKAEPVMAQTIYYLPGLQSFGPFLGLPVWSDYDLDRYVYNEVLKPNNWRAMGLHGGEIDDNWRPYYTALLLKAEVGTVGYVPDAFLVLDPSIKEGINYTVYDIKRNVDPLTQKVSYDLGEIPEWVDNIFPQEFFDENFSLWGEYLDHNTCGWEDSFGRFQVDSRESVFTLNEKEYQVTTTSYNSDASVIHKFYADPDTARVVRYLNEAEPQLTILESVTNTMMERVTGGNSDIPVHISELQLQRMLGTDVIFGIIETPEIRDDYTVYKPKGYGLVQVRYANTSAAYMIAHTVDELYGMLEQQLAQGVDEERNLSEEEGIFVQVVGTLETMGYSFDTTPPSLNLIILTEDGRRLAFRAKPSDYNSLLLLNETITVSAVAIQEGVMNQATEIHSDRLSSIVPILETPLPPLAVPAQ